MASLTKITVGDNIPAYEVGDITLPAVIVLQEWWGVNDIVKKQAEAIAAAGFRVLIPDLYKGKIGVDAEEASHLMNNLDFQNAVKEIGACAQYLKDTGSPKVGATGFCMGGALTFCAGQHVSVLDCIAPNYGIPDARYFQIETIKVPILMTFGGQDKIPGFSDAAAANAAAEKIKAAGGDVTLHIYPSGPHGFLNQVIKPEGVEAVQKFQKTLATEEDVSKAWSTIISFLETQLKA